MAESMTIPNCWTDFVDEYSFKDAKEIYTNGSQLIPVFRVRQMVNFYFGEDDMISRTSARNAICKACGCVFPSCDGACEKTEALAKVPSRVKEGAEKNE